MNPLDEDAPWYCSTCLAELGFSLEEISCDKCGKAIEHGDDWLDQDGLDERKKAEEKEFQKAKADGLIL